MCSHEKLNGYTKINGYIYKCTEDEFYIVIELIAVHTGLMFCLFIYLCLPARC